MDLCNIPKESLFGFKIQIQNPGFFPGFPGIMHGVIILLFCCERGGLVQYSSDLFLLLGFRNPGLFKSQDSREYCTCALKHNLWDYCSKLNFINP